MNARVIPKTSSLQVQPAGIDASLDLSALSAHIAAELAAGLSDPAAIRDRYNISQEQWDRLKKLPAFRQMLTEAVTMLRGDLNAGARITKKAEIVLEDAIPAYDNMIHNKDIPAQARIDAGKLLAQLAGRNNKEGAPAGPVGGGFAINIHIDTGSGAQEKVVKVAGQTLPPLEHA